MIFILIANSVSSLIVSWLQKASFLNKFKKAGGRCKLKLFFLSNCEDLYQILAPFQNMDSLEYRYHGEGIWP